MTREIRVPSFFGVTEVAVLPVPRAVLSRTTIDGMVHLSLDDELLVTIDSEQRSISYAHHSVTVIHQYQGIAQGFFQGYAQVYS
jgi:hypothetical protein